MRSLCWLQQVTENPLLIHIAHRPHAVVLTSSLAAVSAEFKEGGPGHTYSEADWTTNFWELEEPYVT
jgi:hypothetical protein